MLGQHEEAGDGCFENNGMSDADRECIKQEDKGCWKMNLGEGSSVCDQAIDDSFVFVGTLWK